MPCSLTLAVTQMSYGNDPRKNCDRTESLVRKAVAEGGQIILLQELFERPYLCIDQKAAFFDWAYPAEENPLRERFSKLALELEVVLPVSFFESAGNAHFNSVMLFDADGSMLGIYRRSHIPDGPGYQEKFFFTPGDTGFKVWETRFGKVGVGICWDQWFPEAARTMVLLGAEMLLYPTAIGSEPDNPGLDSRKHWQQVMQGHAAANMLPVAGSNRIGVEKGESCSLTFYGSSFIADASGQ